MITRGIWDELMRLPTLTDRGRLVAVHLLYGAWESFSYRPPMPGLGFIHDVVRLIPRQDIATGGLGMGGCFEVDAEMIRVAPELVTQLPKIRNLGVIRGWARRVIGGGHTIAIVQRSLPLVSRHMFALRAVMGTKDLLDFWLLAERAVELNGELPQHIKPPSHGVNVSPKLRRQILERDNFRCAYCGATPAEAELQIDHVVPRAAGGTRDLSNLVTSCQPCNIGKGDRPLKIIHGGR